MIQNSCSDNKDTEHTPRLIRKWYDNEWGYSTRVVDATYLVAAKLVNTTEINHRLAGFNVLSDLFSKTAENNDNLRSWLIGNILGKGVKEPEILINAGHQKRQMFVAGNWKMNHGTREDAVTLIREIAEQLEGVDTKKMDNIVFIVAPSPLHIGLVHNELQSLKLEGLIQLASQDVSAKELGAHTGSIEVGQLKDQGVEYVILGHSELRDEGETDAQINSKAKKVLAMNLKPIICLGETKWERNKGQTYKVLAEQFLGALYGLRPEQARNVVIAYEPRWAIGTGLSAEADDIKETHAFLRALAVYAFGFKVGSHIPIIYGGSLSDQNAADIMPLTNVDGGLIGGAALKARDFIKILQVTLKVSLKRQEADAAMNNRTSDDNQKVYLTKYLIKLGTIVSRERILQILGSVGNVSYQSLCQALQDNRIQDAYDLVARTLNEIQNIGLENLTQDQKILIGLLGRLEQKLINKGAVPDEAMTTWVQVKNDKNETLQDFVNRVDQEYREAGTYILANFEGVYFRYEPFMDAESRSHWIVTTIYDTRFVLNGRKQVKARNPAWEHMVSQQGETLHSFLERVDEQMRDAQGRINILGEYKGISFVYTPSGAAKSIAESFVFGILLGKRHFDGSGWIIGNEVFDIEDVQNVIKTWPENITDRVNGRTFEEDKENTYILISVDLPYVDIRKSLLDNFLSQSRTDNHRFLVDYNGNFVLRVGLNKSTPKVRKVLSQFKADFKIFLERQLEDIQRRLKSLEKKENKDAATLTPGGIDLNTSNGMQWKVSKDGNGVEMNIDPAMIARVRREGIDSLSPVIFRITPITSVWPLVGLQAPVRG